MSFFMLSMPASVLMSRPPVSKQTPLPTSVIFGSLVLAPGDVDQPRRARRAGADRMRPAGNSLASAVAARDLDLGAVLFGERARGASSISAGPMSFDGVLMRSRASVDGLDDARQILAVDAVRHAPAARRALAPCGSGRIDSCRARRPARRAARRAAHWRSDRCRAAATPVSAPGRNRSFAGVVGLFQAEQNDSELAVRRSAR